MITHKILSLIQGARKSANQAIFVYEPSSHGHLAVRAIRLHTRLFDDVHSGPILAL